MHQSAGRRSAFSWVLYASLLFTVLHCGLGHGQAIGLTLNGVGGAFCSHSGIAPDLVSFDKWLGDSLGGISTLDCPLCSHLGLVFSPLQLDHPLVRAHVDSPLPGTPLSWPRRLWPPANPRASPALG
ncbi:hypothetical protein OH708_13925 [Pseudomonas capsici]|uniref:hypothetical protein n=1 Tax=Pseudomonas capsici TaxID=2810614 RepID=UPI0021F13E31|nr:hypothetical protein [Pseudomonas capsici]MCV4289012.1 hypothetical protein [Pseudomonas capsici]